MNARIFRKNQKAAYNNAIEPTGNSLWCFSFKRLCPGRLMANVSATKEKDMTAWYSKEAGDGVAAFGPSTAVQEAFMEVAKLGGFTTDMAVFSRYDLKQNVVTLYFTPSASVLAAAFGAKPSEKPTPDERFGLLVGDQRSWGIHFPNFKPGRRQ